MQARSEDSQGDAAKPRRPALPFLPPIDPGRMLWLGGLGAMAALEIIDWPVALVVGAGTYVAERFTRQDIERRRGAEGRAVSPSD